MWDKKDLVDVKKFIEDIGADKSQLVALDELIYYMQRPFNQLNERS